jgi:hypothetical protein
MKVEEGGPELPPVHVTVSGCVRSVVAALPVLVQVINGLESVTLVEKAGTSPPPNMVNATTGKKNAKAITDNFM